MKGDFTRVTFDPQKRFNRVLKQQGRVDLDADWNELADTLTYLARTQSLDVIGAAGAPKFNGGFQVTAVSTDGSGFTFTPGRMYVDGLLCQLEPGEPASYQTQADYPTPPALAPQNGRTDLVYLDVWERHITALEDPAIREVALGGPDTTTRTRTVWQVKVLPAVGAVTCTDEIPGYPPQASNGRLSTAATQPPASTDPCVISPMGGYRGLENRLYRVEIHDGSDSAGGPTFKWSRDNGSVVFAVEEFIPTDANKIRMKQLGRDQVLALRVNDWVEVLDDNNELLGTPGTLAQISDIDNAQRIITLTQPISGYDTARHAKVRRWDQPNTAVPVTAGPFSLEDGVEISFTGAVFHTGDYWVFAARTATASVETLVDAPAQGIQHHHALLALLTWVQNGEEWTATLTDCRAKFPPLTQICAEDICFDNDNCQLVGAETVQDALDRLCAANDLRHHNKHLHGWGIVCGLQVECGPNLGERRNVTVRDGYALDCDGNDLLIQQNIVIDILQEIERLQAEDPNNPILNENGDGEVCLRVGLGEDRQVQVITERHDPTDNSIQSLLSGTLLMDFYNDCIKVLVDFVQQMITPGADEPNVVTPGQKRLITLLNLLVQVWSPQYGRFVYLSEKEDVILREIYVALRAILQSHTFCAMFENARPFPDYPFRELGMSTIFGKGFHGRLRLHPTRPLAYTIGNNNKIHVYDLEKEELVAEVEVPGGEGIVVRDVAFSTEGERLYAVATVQGADTIFAVAKLDGLDHIWEPITILCDTELVTLATVPRTANELVYAIGKGRGLYAINPDNVPLEPSPLYEFNAVGHLVVSEELNRAYATALTQGTPDYYDVVFGMDLNGGNIFGFFMRDAAGNSLTGRDDIALATSREAPWLFVVADPPPNTSTKHLLRFFATEPGDVPDMLDLEENTEFRLAHVPGSQFLTVSCEDSYRLRSVFVDEPFLMREYQLPVQISPLGMVADPRTERAYALNVLSNTLTKIPTEFLDPETQPFPGSPEFMEQLAAYRTAVFEAFVDLLGGLLQYLKDCLCDHFLVNCPECDGDELIYLGCVSVRGNQVYKVCNFSKRKYVKSFPTVGYWLSLVPIAPFIHLAVEKFCCAVLPDLFGRVVAPRATAYTAPAKGFQVRQGVTVAQNTSLSALWGDLIGQVGLGRQVTADWAKTAVIKPQTMTKGTTKYNEVVGKSVTEASSKLEAAKVSVAGVEAYNPAQVTANLRSVAQAPTRIPPGSEVTLFQQDGVVKYYAVREKTAVSASTTPSSQITADIQSLKNSMLEMQALLAQKDAELVSLRGELQAIEQKQTTPQVAEMAAELQELRTFRTEVVAFMKKRNEG